MLHFTADQEEVMTAVGLALDHKSKPRPIHS